jgi:hypothetical protein
MQKGHINYGLHSIFFFIKLIIFRFKVNYTGFYRIYHYKPNLYFVNFLISLIRNYLGLS